MQLNQLLLLNALPPSSENIEIKGLTCDSRQVEKGFLFAVLSGTKEKGKDFITEAIEKGAACLLVEEGEELSCTEVPIIFVKNIRLVLAKMAAHFYTPQPQRVVGVTGTNGKTSTANFTRQIWEFLGKKSACIGTLGVITNDFSTYGSLTTPDSVTLHKTLQMLCEKDYQDIAIEASSHGIEQHRISGISFASVAFTNITQDHLDYHGTMENYLKAKLGLFDLEITSKNVVLNADIDAFDEIKNYCEKRGLNVIDYGTKAKIICLKDTKRTLNGQTLFLEIKGKAYTVELPLAGTFQALNALCALGLVIACNETDQDKAVLALNHLKGADGRLDYVGTRRNGASVYVDYAHTPDALETILKALRAHTKNRLHIVFGCGGDRDPLKRPEMGRVCDMFADVAYVTDDNPRSEDPVLIRNAILSACPKGINIGSRGLSIQTAVENLEEGDILVIAGKGHETGQLIKGVMHPFNDKEEVLNAIEKADAPLWQAQKIKEITNAITTSEKDFDIFGFSIDTRTLKKGDLFVAIKGESMDGHDYIQAALEKGAVGVLASHIENENQSPKVLIVEDTLKALQDIAKASRERTKAKIIAVTGSSGKTSTKEMLKIALTSVGRTHTTKGNFNNDIGMPLTLALMPKDTKFAVIEMGMNHKGELSALTQLSKPDVTMITMVGAAHCEFFKTEEETAYAKAEIFEGMHEEGIVFLNADNAHFDLLKKEALKNKIKNVLSFGSTAEQDVSLLNVSQTNKGAVVSVRINETNYTYTLGLSGHHQVQNSLGVVGILEALGVDMSTALQALGQLHPQKGRGERFEIDCIAGTFTLIDDAYNANPDSMRAGIRVLGSLTPKNQGRRIAVIGDMLELGEQSQALHIGLKKDLIENKIDLLYTAGENASHLFDEVPQKMRGSKTQTSHELAFIVKKDVKPDDIVLVKGSSGTKMTEIVNVLKNISSNKG